MKNQAALPYLQNIDDITKKAVLLDSFGMDPKKPKSPNPLLMHSMYAVADIGNGPVVLKLYVEEMHDPNKQNTAKRDYQLQNIEIGNLKVQGSHNSVSPIIQTANVRTVSDLFAAVKGYDPDFQPKQASKIVDETGEIIYKTKETSDDTIKTGPETKFPETGVSLEASDIIIPPVSGISNSPSVGNTLRKALTLKAESGE